MSKGLNQIPTSPLPYRLAVVGEGPSSGDIAQGQLYSSESGIYLSNILSNLGVPPTRLFLGSISTKRTYFPQSINSTNVQIGLVQLAKDLREFKPHCILLMGDLAAKAAGFTHTSFTGRGSIFWSTAFNCKCVVTHDAAAVMRNFPWLIAFKSDIKRAKEQSLFPELSLPKRKIQAWPTFDLLIKQLNEIINEKPSIAFDLEGWPNDVGVTCYSIARSPHNIFIVPFRNMDNSPFWSLEEETEIWRLTSRILSDAEIKKTAHNAMYELFVFAWRHKIYVRGLEDDSMYKMWELFCELPKSLAFVSSIFTEEPYYKDERTMPDLSIHHEYCCKDSAVTLESSIAMDAHLKHLPSLNHYRFNIKVQKPYLYMGLRGCKIDTDLWTQKKNNCWQKIQRQQHIVNEMTSEKLNVKSSKQNANFLYKTLGLPEQFKTTNGKKSVTTDMDALAKLYVSHEIPVILEIAKLTRLRTRLSDLNKLTPFPDGRIRTDCNPVATDTGRVASRSTSVTGIINELKIVPDKSKGSALGIKLQTKLAQIQYGTNLQNVTKDLRDLFIPDSDAFSFFQYDLSGADAWTVAADLAALGNNRMLDHLLAGIKPSVVIVLLIEYGNAVYTWSLEKLKEVHHAMLKTLKDPNAPGKLKNAYVGAKACQHGTNYGMQPALMSSLLLKRELSGWVDKFNDGYVENLDLRVTHKYIMERYQKLYSEYYGIETRNEWIKKQLSNFGYIDSASGHRRYFTNIRTRKHIEPAIVRAAASHEPQGNTTYVTNASLINMYYDLENRTPKGNLRCEPMLMIHDALAGQAHHTQVDWATERTKQWFHVPLVIHGIDVTIPVEGGWGKNWKDTD
tara:strand:+ start:4820 stop:7354 length:2535 start_codon:yes stop_codon:yes gene_type:complete